MESLIITFWHWLIIAFVLLVAELMTGTAFFLWLSAACVAVSGIVYFQPEMIWQYQLACACVSIMISVLIWRTVAKLFPPPEREDNVSLNQRGQQYVGRTFVLTQEIVNGIGKINVDDSSWQVMGEDSELNSKVKVIAADGLSLKVEKVETEAK